MSMTQEDFDSMGRTYQEKVCHALIQDEVWADQMMDVAIIGNLYYEAAFSHDGQLPGDQWGLSIAALLAASPKTSLSVGLEQILVSRAHVGGVEVLGSDLVSGTLILGATSVINRYSLLSVAGGVGLTKGAADYSLTVAVPVRLSLFD